MQFGSTKKPAVGLVYDSDFGAGIDTVLALAMLHGLEAKTQARIAAITIANSSLKSAQLCDVVERFYASAITGQAAIFFSRAPIGLAADASAGTAPLVSALLEKKDDSGKPVYPPRIQNLNETAIPEVLIRNALTAQNDGNAAIVLNGPATNLIRLLALNGAKDLIASKVKWLVYAERDAPGPSAKRLFADWPTPVILVPSAIGKELPFPGSSIATEFAYNPTHPVAAAYQVAQTMPYDAPATALAAVLYASHPDDGYFKLSSPSGQTRTLLADPARKEEILKLYVALASAKPAARAPRIPVVVDEVKAEEQIKKD